MSEAPKLRVVADNAARDDRLRDIFLRLRAFAPDPDGEHIWLLLDPPATDANAKG